MKIWTRLSPPTTAYDALTPATTREAGGPLAIPSFGGIGRSPPTVRQRVGNFFTRRPYFWSVLVPTMLAAVYFFAVAAPQFISESRFIVRARQQSSQSILGEALNNAGFRSASEDALAVKDFLLSHDAVTALRQQFDLVGMFRRPEADAWARLWYSTPASERLLDYYRNQVTAIIDAQSGITELRVRSFRPQDSLEVNRALLAQGEALVNRLNQRIAQDTVEGARREVVRAEGRIAAATQAISEFRERERALDPSRSATLAVETIGRLESQLATTRAELQTLTAFARPNNPQVTNLQSRIQALQTQINEERRRSTATTTEGFTTQIAAFERLRMEAEFGGRQLTSATASLERALADAQRQQLYLQRVVEPNLAEHYRYPRRFISVLYVFVGLSVLYGLIWLMVAGVKEHAA